MTTNHKSSPATSHLLPDPPVSLSHHQRRCGICHHPDRHWIEEDFLRWRSPWEIRREYQLPDRSSIYRHARAFGLLALRKHNLRSALELLIEQVELVKPSASAIVRAIRAYTRLTDDGQWIDPPTHAILTHTTAPPIPPHTPSSLKPPASSFKPPERLDPPVSPSLQHPASSFQNASSFENAPEATAGLPQPQPISSGASSTSDLPSLAGSVGIPGPDLQHPVSSSLEAPVSGLQNDPAFRSLAAVVHKVRATLAQNKPRARRTQAGTRRAKSPQYKTRSI